jgi:hypothetical protein
MEALVAVRNVKRQATNGFTFGYVYHVAMSDVAIPQKTSMQQSTFTKQIIL